jgi:hypothetical protein
MKTRVLRDRFKEKEIRPQKEFLEYLKLIDQDVKDIFKSSAGNFFKYCPACTSESSNFSFSKHSFTYRECNDCGTIYMTPRPTREMLHDFFENSKGLKYWNLKLVKGSVSRRKHIYLPLIRWIEESLEFTSESERIYCDMYSKYSWLVNGISSIKQFSGQVSYKPIKEIDKKLKKNNFSVIQNFTDKKYSVITGFEIIDRLYNPREMLGHIKNNMEDGGLLFISAMTSSGLDFQYLKEKSKNLVPPMHMNIFSIEGIVKMFEDFDFEIIELSTPGMLDVNILENNIDNIELPKFIKDIICNRDTLVKEAFQEFLQRGRLSSYLRLLVRKKG